MIEAAFLAPDLQTPAYSNMHKVYSTYEYYIGMLISALRE